MENLYFKNILAGYTVVYNPADRVFFSFIYEWLWIVSKLIFYIHILKLAKFEIFKIHTRLT
jgi:hypothetical protein